MTKPSSTLGSTRPLYQWLRRQPDWHQVSWQHKALLAWKSVLGSANARLSSELSHPGELEGSPLLIIGPWRSGTTVMHELLYASGSFPTPLTWQCMNATAFQLLRAPNVSEAIARPMDGLGIGNLSPQEDEFALLTLGVDSAYRAFLMPTVLNDLLPTLEQDYWLRNTDWLKTWELFLRGVVRSASASKKPLLLKSPNHTFRLQAILQRYPAARFIWMARDPIACFHSNQKMWRAMFHSHALTEKRPSSKDLDQFLALAFQQAAKTLEWMVDSLPSNQWVICRQDALRMDPLSQLKRVGERLGVPLDSRLESSALGLALANTGKGRIESYDTAPPAEALVALQALQAAQERALMVG